MAQSNNDSIIQQYLNPTVPEQEDNPTTYDFIGQSDAPTATAPPPTNTTIAKSKLAIAKNNSKQNIDTAKKVLQAKKALGVDPRIATHTQYMEGIDKRNEGITSKQSNIHNNP